MKGFTMLELLVVMTIMAIIASATVPKTVSLIQRGRQAKTMTMAQAISAAGADYHIKNGNFPSTVSCPAMANALVPEFLGALSCNDAWGNPFIVTDDTTDPDAPIFIVCSQGADGSADQAGVCNKQAYLAVAHQGVGVITDVNGDIGYTNGMMWLGP